MCTARVLVEFDVEVMAARLSHRKSANLVVGVAQKTVEGAAVAACTVHGISFPVQRLVGRLSDVATNIEGNDRDVEVATYRIVQWS